MEHTGNAKSSLQWGKRKEKEQTADGNTSHMCRQAREPAAAQSRSEEDRHGLHHAPNGEDGPNHEGCVHVQGRALSHEQTMPNAGSLPRLEGRWWEGWRATR